MNGGDCNQVANCVRQGKVVINCAAVERVTKCARIESEMYARKVVAILGRVRP